MEYLITIKQPYVDFIFQHKKIYEVRKVVPKGLSNDDVIYFCVKGNGNLVVGSFIVDDVLFFPVALVRKYYLTETMIDGWDLIRYVRKNSSEKLSDIHNRWINLIKITKVKKIKPFHVGLLGLKSAPQNFVKIDTSKIIRK